MNRNIFKTPLLAFCFLTIPIVFFSCFRGDKKERKEYYPSGQIRQIARFVNDTIMVDSAINYYENGKVAAIEVRDSLGRLNGLSSYFYKSGDIYQTIPYKLGLAEGFVTSFFEGGKKETMSYYYQNSPVGDIYFFDSATQKIIAYNFLDFFGNNINLIEWDTSGTLITDDSRFIHYDSVKIDRKRYEGEKKLNCIVRVLLSNPPTRRSQVVIHYVSFQNAVLDSDTIAGASYYYIEKKMSLNLKEIQFKGELYDSVTKKTYYESKRFLLDSTQREL